jgi:hypothetical protein
MASTTLRPSGNAARRVPVLPSRNLLLGNMREIQQDPPAGYCGDHAVACRPPSRPTG